MNGLEAIELMKQGKMIKSGIWIYSMDSASVIWLKNESCTGWVEAEMFNILANDYEEYIEPKPLTGWERVEGEPFCAIATTGVSDSIDMGYFSDIKRHEIANYFSTKEKAEEIDFKQTLFRKLQRFSDENGGNEIDWDDRSKGKYFIYYSHYRDELEIDNWCGTQYQGTVYFISKEVAEKAIELFHDDLIKYFTGDFGGEA